MLFSSGSAFTGSMLNGPGPVVLQPIQTTTSPESEGIKIRKKKNYLLLVVLLAVLLATLLAAGVMCTNSYILS